MMIDKTVGKLEETVAGATAISDKKRTQLLKLISELKSEISTLSETDKDSALDIINKTHASARHAIQEESDENQFASGLEDLKSTVDTFEVSHPGLVSVVNSLCNALADLGI
ncbi:MAG: DUF4404 family protein [Candidatus Auribacterota bacterium]|nr:DUF4404 family protein [Candidatus Auribacterota bacterium]